MPPKALIIDADTADRDAVAEVLASLGHEFDAAANQADARHLLDANRYAYILLEINIPARPGSGSARPVNGENLLGEIRGNASTRTTPVIIVTAHGSEGPALAVRLMKKGAVDFVKKPLDGDALDRAILEALGRNDRKAPAAAVADWKRFEGGELVFYPDRVELCGVAIVSSGRSRQMWTILDALNQRLDSGRYKALEGNALANLVDGDGGQGSIAGSVRDFRRNVAEQLGREVGLKVERDDVIETSKAGYRLNESIVVKDLRESGPRPLRNNQSSGEEAPADDRRDRILSLFRDGERLRVPGIAGIIECSYATAKRDVEALKAEGRITFVGPGKTGFYQLVRASSPVGNGR